MISMKIILLEKKRISFLQSPTFSITMRNALKTMCLSSPGDYVIYQFTLMCLSSPGDYVIYKFTLLSYPGL